MNLPLLRAVTPFVGEVRFGFRFHAITIAYFYLFDIN